MNFSFLKPWILIALLSSPVVSHAILTGDDIVIFKKSCKSAWMKDTENVTNKVEYKDFGDKYCDCMADKPMDTDDQMKSSAHLCVTQTLLRTTMSTLEENGGLTGLTESKIGEACVTKWNVIYAGLTGNSKPQISSFCDCSAPKLNMLNSKHDNMTDEQWNMGIDKIATDCSSSVPSADKTPATTTTTTETTKTTTTTPSTDKTTDMGTTDTSTTDTSTGSSSY